MSGTEDLRVILSESLSVLLLFKIISAVDPIPLVQGIQLEDMTYIKRSINPRIKYVNLSMWRARELKTPSITEVDLIRHTWES